MCVFEKSPVAVLEGNVLRWLDGQPIILFALTCFSFSQESYLVNPPSRTFRMQYAILQCNRSNCNSNWLGFYLQNFYILITNWDYMGGAHAERKDFAKGARSDL